MASRVRSRGARGCAASAWNVHGRPNTRFPAPLNDCIAAVRWAASGGSELGMRQDQRAQGPSSANPTRVSPCHSKSRSNDALDGMHKVVDEGGGKVDIRTANRPRRPRDGWLKVAFVSDLIAALDDQ
jgi:hypothetical protein